MQSDSSKSDAERQAAYDASIEKQRRHLALRGKQKQLEIMKKVPGYLSHTQTHTYIDTSHPKYCL